ncbi:phosphodiesterase, MJ0936 family protein [Halorubrum aidingense JCM 13560]|uniref:Phosphoesterase n=1 Tax=Halorubrum aidingense JCM 13560 TaxID=1230454 RepID=M0P4T7_9EURY|nr:metallophosphoesterase [Halorubrum aidingense]EMA65157.1 phosphodiesterase, MJ0936 family protein [Halorubrum aidingense JCM 13560]
MLVVVSDTHSREESKLQGRTAEAVREAELVVHVGDFYREPVLDAFESASRALRGVYGNNDDAMIRERLPEVRTVEYAGVRFAVTHRHRSGDTGLVMLGRGRDADAVICGHTHRPRFDDSTGLPILNPGSHAEPRGNRPAHAELEPASGAGDESEQADSNPDAGLDGRLVTPAGEVFEEFRIRP